MKTQEFLVVAPDVLLKVLMSPKISNYPAIRGTFDSVAWLRAVVRVDWIEETSLLRISASGLEPPFQVELINAIAETYTSMARQRFEEELRSVWDMEASLRKSLGQERDQLRVEMDRDPHSAAVEALKDRIAVDQELWKKFASIMRMFESGGKYEVSLGQRAVLSKGL